MNFFVKKIVKSTLCSLLLLSSQAFGAAAAPAVAPADEASVAWNTGILSEFDPRGAGINQCHLISFHVCQLKRFCPQWNQLALHDQEFLILCRQITSKSDPEIKMSFARKMIAWIRQQCESVFLALVPMARERQARLDKQKPSLSALFPKFPGIVLWLRLLEQNPFPVLLNIRLVESREQDTDAIPAMVQILFTPGAQGQLFGQPIADVHIDQEQPLLVVDAVTNNADGWREGSASRTQKVDFLSNNFADWQLEMAASWMQENQRWGVAMTQALPLRDEFQECLRQARVHGCWPIDWDDTLRARAKRVLHTLEIKHIFPATWREIMMSEQQ